MARKPDFFSQLERADLERLEAFTREPGRTVDAVHEWLLAEGFTASRSAVHRWKVNFDEVDRLSGAANLIDNINSASEEFGGLDMTKGLQRMIVQRLANRLAKDGEDGDNEYLYRASRTLESLVRSGRHNAKLEQELRDLKKTSREEIDKLAKLAERRQITPDDIAAVSEKVFGKR